VKKSKSEKEPAMATAPIYPEHEAATWSIDFLYNGTTMTVTYPALIGVQYGDYVNFTNDPNSTAPISITFNPNPTGVPNPPGPVLFSSIPASSPLQPGATSQEQPQATNGSVNYFVTVEGGATFGPYAIQVGSGPLYVEIAGSSSQPDPIMVPKGGTLQMYSNDTNTYRIGWTALDPFPGLTQANPGWSNNNPYTQSGPVRGYPYTITVEGQQGPGGGRVIIG
jgi:hypothetical protein